ncbi:MAG: hypothetical protein JNL73_06275, partial [Anaerolineales bacterium]|nr:hypothetical protein [Anaerolineales bacterium]
MHTTRKWMGAFLSATLLLAACAPAATPTTAPAATEAPAQPTEAPAEQPTQAAVSGEPVTFEPGQDFNAILLPKFTGIAVFDQANEGAQEAAAELGATPAEFLGPTAENSVAGQIEI